jgi:hypothetical protein
VSELDYIATVVTLTLVVALVIASAEIHWRRPQRKRAAHLDLAHTYVAAAEQRGGEGADKKRWAIERMMEHGVKNTVAEGLVEFAVRKSKHG